MILETEKTHDRPLASWRTREGSRVVLPSPKASEPGTPMDVGPESGSCWNLLMWTFPFSKLQKCWDWDIAFSRAGDDHLKK